VKTPERRVSQLSTIHIARTIWFQHHGLMNSTAQDWIQDGLVHTEAQEFPDAVACFQRALEIDSASAHAWYCLGCTYNALGDRLKAVSAFKACTKHAPDRAEGWYNLGNCLQDLGALALMKRGVEASAALDQARAYTGDSPDLWNNIGEVYFMLERFPQALAAYDMARRKLPGYYPACYGKARSHLMLGQKTEAKEACREYLAAAEAKDPLVPTIQRMLALCD